jgi:hypothetical protein
MATIGRASAVAVSGGCAFAIHRWLAWLFVHILNLIGFRNRLRSRCSGPGLLSYQRISYHGIIPGPDTGK